MTKRVSQRAYARNILAILAQATDSDIAEGQHWYRRAETFAAKLSADHGCTYAQAVGVLAALSPNNRWSRNCSDADRMIQAWAAGKNPRSVRVCTYGLNRDKAARILELTAPTIEVIASIVHGTAGRKVQAFFLSITGHQDAVCVDGHAYAIWKGQRVPTTKTPKLGVRLYDRIARSYVVAASRSLETCGVQLTPAQVQAVTWVAYRRLIGIRDSGQLISD